MQIVENLKKKIKKLNNIAVDAPKVATKPRNLSYRA